MSAEKTDTPDHAALAAENGCLVFIVGPSGAGKDTLIRLAATALADVPEVRIARRVVTRKPNEHEDHGSLDEAAFERLSGAGGFCLEWYAHGLKYGIPREVEDDVRSGAIVLCNGSRAATAVMRRRFARARVVLVTAPRDVLAARIRARGRDDIGRLDRDLESWAPEDADFIIDNTGAPDAAAHQLVRYVTSLGDGLLFPAGA